MEVVFVLAVLVAAAIGNEKHSTEKDNFDVEAATADINELRKYSECFLDRSDCEEIAAGFKKDIGEAVNNACIKCTDSHKHIFKTYLDRVKERLPEHYEDFKKKYDPENKHFDALEKALEKA